MAIRVPTKQTTTSLQIPTDNYIIFYHTGKSYVIPVDPETIMDSMSASFASSTPLSRSAPIYSYQNSGPRSVQFSFTLHRDLCKEFNPGSEDMVDELIDNLEGMVLPDYESANKVVNPPIVGVKIRDEIWIKGVVSGSVSKSFQVPILKYGDKYKYALVTLSFSVTEIKPYSASILDSIQGGRRVGG